MYNLTCPYNITKLLIKRQLIYTALQYNSMISQLCRPTLCFCHNPASQPMMPVLRQDDDPSDCHALIINR